MSAIGFNVITTNNLFAFFSTVLRSHRKRAASPPVTLPHNHDPPPRTPPKSAAPEVSDLKNFILTIPCDKFLIDCMKGSDEIFYFVLPMIFAGQSRC